MSFIVDYPQELEQWWMAFALQQFHSESLHQAEHQIERRIQFLSDQFTKQRPDLRSDYFADPELLAAYGLFFFPQSYVRASVVLQEVVSRGWRPEGTISVLDLGSGPGSASFAAASLFSNQSVEVTALDRSTHALHVLDWIAKDRVDSWPLLNVNTYRQELWAWLSKVPQQYDLILASFSFNESPLDHPSATSILARALTDRGIVVILEPALKDTSENLERWRDEIAMNPDLQIWAPCPHQAPCPLLKEGKFWCHEVRSWEPPVSLQFLNRHLYRQVHVLKFSFLAFGKQEPDTIHSSEFRLISPVSKRKKALLFTGCCQDGTKKDFQLSGTLTEHERKQIQEWERGDRIDSRFLDRGKVR